MNQTIRYIEALASGRFWGALTLRFEDGRIVHMKKEESIIPSRLTEDPRKQHDGSRQ
jgi:hypothetical protein